MSRLRPAGSALRELEPVWLALGAGLTFCAAYASVQAGATVGVGAPLALLAFVGLVAAFVVAPHVSVACTIPLYAAIPTFKLVFPWIGASKDVITGAAVIAVGVVWLRRGGWPADRWVLIAVSLLLGLYVLNLGGGFAGNSFDLAWFHGVRLIAEPLLLLVVGLGLAQPRRTLRWAVGSLIFSAAGVALVGLAQQVVGADRLIAFGYDYNKQVRTIGDHLRSFGTFDEPFAYAAFLLFGLAAAMFGVRRGPFAWVAVVLIAAGLAASLTRTAAVVSIALTALWLARRGFLPVAILLGAASVVAAAAFLVSSAGATKSKTVVAGNSTYLTINGRTEAWKVALGRPADWPFGRGVGEVGTAAERATVAVSDRRKTGGPSGAVDSGYFATIADIGLVGLGVLLALLGRLLVLSRRAVARDRSEGWLAAALVTALIMDAITRASFTAFPTAYLGLLLAGLALHTAFREDPVRAGRA
jgi:hypothetical protein